jgi:succinyl-CoA synthetase alpha subunit
LAADPDTVAAVLDMEVGSSQEEEARVAVAQAAAGVPVVNVNLPVQASIPAWVVLWEELVAAAAAVEMGPKLLD